MGANPNDPFARKDEFPRHPTEVSDFWMDQTEVSNAEFRAFTEATTYLTTAERPISLVEIMAQLPAGTPAPDTSLLKPSFVGLPFAQRPSSIPSLRLVGIQAWRQLAPPARPEIGPERQRRPSRRSYFMA